jgi:hypothetical protein
VKLELNSRVKVLDLKMGVRCCGSGRKGQGIVSVRSGGHLQHLESLDT